VARASQLEYPTSCDLEFSTQILIHKYHSCDAILISKFGFEPRIIILAAVASCRSVDVIQLTSLDITPRLISFTIIDQGLALGLNSVQGSRNSHNG
jgi:hypothetical protein